MPRSILSETRIRSASDRACVFTELHCISAFLSVKQGQQQKLNLGAVVSITLRKLFSTAKFNICYYCFCYYFIIQLVIVRWIGYWQFYWGASQLGLFLYLKGPWRRIWLSQLKWWGGTGRRWTEARNATAPRTAPLQKRIIWPTTVNHDEAEEGCFIVSFSPRRHPWRVNVTIFKSLLLITRDVFHSFL